MKNKPQNHHYQSQFLIRNFAIDPNRSKKNQEVFVLHKWTKEIEKIKISELCSMPNFNSGAQEKRFSKMERKYYSPSLQNYLEGTHNSIDIHNLKYYACVLLCCTPEFRQNTLRYLTCNMESQLGQPYGSINIRDYIYGKYDLSLACAEAVFKEIKEWKVVYLENNAQGFITSNSPVKINNEEKGYFNINMEYFINPQDVELHENNISFGFGFNIDNADLKANPWIQFSISPDKILIFAPTIKIIDSVISRYKSKSAKDIIKDINTLIFVHSEEYAISSKRELLEEVKPLVNFETKQFDSIEEIEKRRNI